LLSQFNEKLQNLYLYIPPHSCHSPGVIKGLIYGCVNRAKALCTNEDDWMPYIQKTFNRLLIRGHSASDLLPTFNLVIEKIFVKRTHCETIIAHLHAQNKEIPLFFHLPFTLTTHLAAPYKQPFWIFHTGLFLSIQETYNAIGSVNIKLEFQFPYPNKIWFYQSIRWTL